MELRESIHADYLSIMTTASKILFWSSIALGFVGFFIASYKGAIFGILGLIGIFYIFVFFWLIIRIFEK